jgi:hypothetical protein
MFEFHRSHLYDYTARRTDRANGQTSIRFGVDDAFLSGGPHRVAVKITYLDRDHAQWAFTYQTSDQKTATRSVSCGNTGKVRTATFILQDAQFAGRGYTGSDLRIKATEGDAVIRLVRVIKLW